MRLILIRHAETEWNAAGRIQGRSDTSISERGRRDAESWRLPPGLSPARWVTSPLRRARETADVLGVDAAVEPLLAEMDWGDWEGESLSDLRNRLGDEMAANEGHGLDFQPPGGESPRMVQERVSPWLTALAGCSEDTGAITHKGVIRAIVALAAQWNMIGKPPARVSSGTAQIIGISHGGVLRLEAADVMLADRGYPDVND